MGAQCSQRFGSGACHWILWIGVAAGLAGCSKAIGPRDTGPIPVAAASTTGGLVAAGGSASASTTSTATSGAESPVPDAEGNLPYAPPSAAAPALEARTWKLSNVQYQRSIEDLLGVTVALVDDTGAPRLAPDVDNSLFVNMSDSGFVSIANNLAVDYMNLAREAVDALSEAQMLALGGGCTALDASCRDSFLTTSLGRAFRRPASEEDLSAYGALFDAAEMEATAVGDALFPFRAVLRAELTSPFFLYRTEIGSDPAQVDFAMTSHEVASFLSYSILDRPPSAELLAAADRSELSDTATLASWVDAMLGDAAAEEQLQHFVTQWMEIHHFLDPELGVGREGVKDTPGFEDVKQAMQAEALGFLAEHGGMNGTLSGLLTAPVTVTDPLLANFYASEPSGATADQTRIGLLSLGTVLSLKAKPTSTSPTLRGLFVRERLLCQDFTIPAGVIPDLSAVLEQQTPQTTRELYELHAAEPSCAACHDLLDPLGFTLEGFDEAGRVRTAQGTVPVDTTGPLLNTDVNLEMQDYRDLADALSRSEWVRECVSRQAFRFYFGQATSLVQSSDGTRHGEDRGLPPIQAGRAALEAGGTMRELVLALTTSPSSIERTRRDATVSP